MRCSSSVLISLSVASSFNCTLGFCRRALASSGASSKSNSSRSYVASKLVFSLEGTKTGSMCFFSKASKSILRKNAWSAKVSNPIAPIRFLRSFSNNDVIAWRHGIDTGGCVTG